MWSWHLEHAGATSINDRERHHCSRQNDWSPNRIYRFGIRSALGSLRISARPRPRAFVDRAAHTNDTGTSGRFVNDAQRTEEIGECCYRNATWCAVQSMGVIHHHPAPIRSEREVSTRFVRDAQRVRSMGSIRWLLLRERDWRTSCT